MWVRTQKLVTKGSLELVQAHAHPRKGTLGKLQISYSSAFVLSVHPRGLVTQFDAFAH